MPEFIPDHTPRGLDDFTTGYLAAAEWLASNGRPDQSDDSMTNADRAKCRGFTKAAIAEAVRTCAEFQRAHESDLDSYCELSDRDMESAGHDFWLSRNGHGAGYFDRGDDPVFNRLQEVASEYGESYCEMGRTGWLSFTP